MELVLFFLIMLVLGSLLYLLLCLVYFASTGRPVLLAFKLCWKMSIGSIIGFPLLGFGAVLLPAILFSAAIEPLPNYSKLRDIAVAFLMAAIVGIALFFLALTLAWEVFE